MNLKSVKTAEGCRLRDPKTKAVLPNVADADAAAVLVDLDDPHWYRALQCGDIVVQADAQSATATPAASAAITSSTATAATTAASATATKSA